MEALPHNRREERHASHGTVWIVGGLTPRWTAIENGRNQPPRREPTTRVFTVSPFVGKATEYGMDMYGVRVASALEIDRNRKVLDFGRCLGVASYAEKTLACASPAHAMTALGRRLEWIPSGRACGKQN